MFFSSSILDLIPVVGYGNFLVTKSLFFSIHHVIILDLLKYFYSFLTGIPAYDLCLRLRDAGLLTKTTHGQTIRLAPPLCITEQQIREGANIIRTVLESYDK